MNIPVYGQDYKTIGAWDQVLKAKANPVPNMTVRINPGSCWINKTLVEYAGGSITLVAATAGTYVAVIGLRNNQLIAIYGNASSSNNPALPESYPTNFIPLAGVVIPAGTTAIYEDQIQDLRPLFATTSVISKHSDLTDSSNANLHPISSIIGLQDILDEKITMPQVEERLTNISTSEGTVNPTFTINKGATGLNSTDIVLEFKRGTQSSAGIRWNENLDRMEFTDGDGNWKPFDATTEDPLNQEQLVFKGDLSILEQDIRSILSTKADSAEVQRKIEAACTKFVTNDYLLTLLNNVYSKQDMDFIYKNTKDAELAIESKVNKDEVYTKEEVDTKLNDINSTINVDGTTIDQRIANAVDAAKNELNTIIDNNATDAQNNLTTTKDEINSSVDAKFEEAYAKVDAAVIDAKKVADDATEKIAQNLANTLASYTLTAGNLQSKFDSKVEEIEAVHNEFETVVTQVANDYAELKEQTDAKIADKAEKIDVYTKDKVYNKEETYAKDEVYTKDETDVQVDSAVADVLDVVNGALATAIGSGEISGSSDISAATAAADAAKYITDLKKSIDDNVANSVSKAKEEVETSILEQIDISDFTQIVVDEQLNTAVADAKAELSEALTNKEAALAESIDTLTQNIENSISQLNESLSQTNDSITQLSASTDETVADIRQNMETMNNTIVANKVAATDEFAAVRTEMSDRARTVEAEYVLINKKIDDNVATLNTNIAAKADAEAVYVKAEIDQKISEVDKSSDMYIKAEVDAKLDEKANIKDVYKYTEAQVNGMLENHQTDILGYTPENILNKNQPDGYAGLDANGKLSINLLPDSAKQSTHVVANAAGRLALTDLISGMKVFEIDSGDSYIYDGSKWILTAASNWENINLDYNNIVNRPTTITGYGITDAYAKTEVDRKFAATNHTHAATDVETDNDHMFISLEQIRALNGKADLSAVYTQAAADSLFLKKAEFESGISAYTNTAGMNEAIAAATAPLAKSEDVYTKTDINDILSDKVAVKDFEDLDARVDKNQQDTDSAINTVDNRVTELENALNTKETEIYNNIASEVSTINNTLNDYAMTSAMEAAIDTAKADIHSDLTKDYMTAKDTTDAISAAFGELTSAIEDAKSELNDTIDAVSDKVDELDTRLSNDISTIQGDVTTAQNDISDLQDDITNIQNSLSNDYSTTAVVQQDINSAIDSAKTELQSSITAAAKDVQDNVDVIDGRVDVLENTAAQLTGDITNLDTKVNSKQNALGYTPEDAANKNVADGYAGLDANGKISVDLLPDSAKQPTHVVVDAAERNALQDLISGVRAFETSTGDSYIYNGSEWVLTADADWANVNLDYNNIINKPTTAAGYGITDVYTKTEIDSNLNTTLEEYVKHDSVFNSSGVFETTATDAAKNNWSKLFGESDGGGAMAYVKASDVKAFAGVNTDEVNVNASGVDTAINVQLYAKYSTSKADRTEAKDFGSRLNVNTHGIYYLVGTSKVNTAEREVAVKADVNAVNDLITTLTERIAELEARVAALEA